MEMQKRLPVGIDDFRKMRENCYFVDKTRFIKEFLDNYGDVTLITRPRRFGKSMALSMLSYFFTLENAEENRKLFAGTDIERAGARYMAEQGQWPVVMLSLKDLKPLTYKSMLAQMAIVMHRLYACHRYLLDDFLQGEDFAAFQDILYERAREDKLQASLSDLLCFLQHYHGKQVILLLDEYDSPIQAAWSAKESYYDEAIAFMRGFLTSALKGNTALRFGVLTGVLRVAKESIFSALNNLKVSTVVRGRYGDIFGFTEEEVTALAKELGYEDKLEEIRVWYDGYAFSGQEIYNPWSVINYFDDACQPGIFWLNTSGNGIIAEMMQHAGKEDEQKILSLLEGKSLRIYVDEGVIYTEIYQDPDALYTMLLTTGYLKAVRTELVAGDTFCDVKIPNREVRVVYRKEVLNRYSRRLGRSGLEEIVTCLLRGEAEEFAAGLGKYLEQIASFHDTGERESFYHGFVLGLMAWLMPRYRVVSNRESGYGRFDIGVFPKEENLPGLILEFKVAETEAELERAVHEALAQIEEKHYISEFEAQGVRNVWQYGVAFCGKRVKLLAKA